MMEELNTVLKKKVKLLLNMLFYLLYFKYLKEKILALITVYRKALLKCTYY